MISQILVSITFFGTVGVTKRRGNIKVVIRPMDSITIVPNPDRWQGDKQTKTGDQFRKIFSSKKNVNAEKLNTNSCTPLLYHGKNKA